MNGEKIGEKKGPHAWCSKFEPCEARTPESCPREPMRELRRRAKDGSWSQLLVHLEEGGARHFLDGEPVHAADVIELQAIETRFDPEDAEYTAVLPRGRLVRYEAVFHWRAVAATLYTTVDGHTFEIAHAQWMRFRWPVKS